MFEKLISIIINNGMVVASEKFSKYVLGIDHNNKAYVSVLDYLYANFINDSYRDLFVNDAQTLLYRPMKYYKLDKYNYIISLEYINYSMPNEIKVGNGFDLVSESKEEFNNYTCKVGRPKNFYKYSDYVGGTNTELWIVGLNPEAKLQEILNAYILKYEVSKADTCPMIYYDGNYINKKKNQYKDCLDMIDNLNIDCIPDGLCETRKFVVDTLDEVFKILIVDNGGHSINDITFKIASKMKLYVVNHIDKINYITPFKMNGIIVLYDANEWSRNILKEAENDIFISSITKTVVEVISDIKLLSVNQLDSYHIIIYSNSLSRKDAEKYCDYCKVNYEILDLIKFPIDIKILNKYILNLVSTRH